jgi:Kef-type K+ transport systems, membrane components
MHQLSVLLEIKLPDFSTILPVLGTVGLVLIVLEGSLELELGKHKIPLIKKSTILSVVPMLILAFGLTIALMLIWGLSFRDCLINVIPLCIISSAIAIPSVKALSKSKKEFIIYESSFSDILGILFFNYVTFNDSFGLASVGSFTLQILLITILSVVLTIGLSLLLHRINHHIKFVPILLLVVLIYALSKLYHLPGLIFILIMGLMLGNVEILKRYNRFQFVNADELNREIVKFRDVLSETAFVVRALFFLLFGYLIDNSELLNIHTLALSAGIVAFIFVLRYLFLRLLKLETSPLLYIAPRGLITILLFLSIEPVNRIAVINNSLLIQVIILSAFIMMIGLMTHRESLAKHAAGNNPHTNNPA